MPGPKSRGPVSVEGAARSPAAARGSTPRGSTGRTPRIGGRSPLRRRRRGHDAEREGRREPGEEPHPSASPSVPPLFNTSRALPVSSQTGSNPSGIGPHDVALVPFVLNLLGPDDHRPARLPPAQGSRKVSRLRPSGRQLLKEVDRRAVVGREDGDPLPVPLGAVDRPAQIHGAAPGMIPRPPIVRRPPRPVAIRS